MTIVDLAPPGRFPTVVHDPGGWWSALQTDARFRLVRFSANYEFWRVLCGPDAIDLLGRSLKQHLLRTIHERTLRESGIHARDALNRMRSVASFASPECYVRAVTPIASHLSTLNRFQDELQFLSEGTFVRGLNYDSSHALVEYAERKTPLSRLLSDALSGCPDDVRLLAVKVTAPEDLLTALVAVRVLRQKNSLMHACLVDHSYENFSLTPYVRGLRGAGTLTRIFDSIIESQDDRDVVVPALAHAPQTGEFRLPQSRTGLDTAAFDTATGFKPRDTLEEIVESFVRAERTQTRVYSGTV